MSNILFEMSLGSNLHGTAEYGKSDTDKLIVTIPTMDEILLSNSCYSYSSKANVSKMEERSKRLDVIECTVGEYVDRVFRGHIQMGESIHALDTAIVTDNPFCIALFDRLKTIFEQNRHLLRDILLLKVSNYISNAHISKGVHTTPRELYHFMRLIYEFNQLNVRGNIEFPLKESKFLKEVKYTDSKVIEFSEVDASNKFSNFLKVIESKRKYLKEVIDLADVHRIKTNVILAIHKSIFLNELNNNE